MVTVQHKYFADFAEIGGECLAFGTLVQIGSNVNRDLTGICVGGMLVRLCGVQSLASAKEQAWRVAGLMG